MPQSQERREQRPFGLLSENDKEEIRVKMVMIMVFPEEHDHGDMESFNACCTINGVFAWVLIEIHDLYATLGRNGAGKRCDAVVGLCACGAWHRIGEPR